MITDEQADQFHAMIVEYNPHRANYETISRYLRFREEGVPAGCDDWPRLVTVQIYPRTPVGFVFGFGATLDAAWSMAVGEL